LEVEVSLATQALVLSPPVHQQPERSRLFDLEAPIGVVAGRELFAVRALDQDIEPSLAHELPSLPNPEQRSAALPVHLELQDAVLNHQQVPLLGRLNSPSGRRIRGRLVHHQGAAILLKRSEVPLVVDEQPADASVIVALEHAGLNRTRAPLLVEE